MHINYQYQLHWANVGVSGNRSASILDYGCGSDEVVISGRAAGLNIYGADVFYEGGNSLDAVSASGLFGDVIRRVDGDRLDFPDGFFDLVMSNQVLEHVDMLDPVLAEICRTMKTGGKFLSIFPTRATIPEKHIGIPFAHWFAPGNQARYPYTWMMRLLGFGAHKGKASVTEWTMSQLDWLDSYTHYRTRKEIMETFMRHFKVSGFELDYIRFRLAQRYGLKNMAILEIPLVCRAATGAFQRLAGMVVLCKKCKDAIS